MIKSSWFKPAVFIFLVFVLVSVFAFFSIKGGDFGVTSQKNNVAKRSLFRGEEMFNAGGYAAIKNISLENGCGYESLADQMICSEGYHHVSTATLLNKKVVANEDVQSESIALKSMAHALGVGVALSSLGMLPTDFKFTQNNRLIKYVYDGWGQHEAYLKKFSGLNSACRFPKYNKYCEFGLGRSIFVLSINKSEYRVTEWIQKGIEFAEIFEGAQADKMAQKLKHREIATTLRFDKNAKTSKHYQCIRQPMGHILDCD